MLGTDPHLLGVELLSRSLVCSTETIAAKALTMSLPPSFELCGCPLPSVNGKYLLSENRLSYTHANASYGLRQTEGGFWAVVETRTGMQVGKSSVPSNVPPRFGWEYYNLKEQVLKPAKSMQCMMDGDEPVDIDPVEEEDDDPANYDPVLLAESFDTLVDPGRPVPTLPAIEHGAHVNVCSFHVTSMRGKKVEVFVPLSGASELGKEVVRRSHLSSFEEIEPFWVSTVATYEHKIATETAEYATREADLRSTIDKLRGGAQESNRREQLLRQHSNTLKLQHKAQYVKRDAYLNQAPPTSSSNGINSDFPHGETIRNEFSTVYLQFETFATDAVNCLQQHMGQTEPATAFTLHVMLPIFETTRRFVEERLEAKRALLKSGFGVTLDDARAEESAVKAFWLHSQQAQLGAEIALLREDVVNTMIGSMGPLLAELEVIMHKAALVGEIAAGEQTLRIPKLIRTFLRFHMVALLSEPRCYLHPAPCERVHHKEGYSTEILSPGAKTHGRIKEGAEVEVMLPGLYFDAPGGAAKPVFPCLVRRLTVL